MRSSGFILPGFLLAVIFLFSCNKEAAFSPSLVPLPEKMITGIKTFSFDPVINIDYPAEFNIEAEIFISQLIELTVISGVNYSNSNADISFVLSETAGPEGSYFIHHKKGKITVEGADKAGLFYAGQTILQLFMQQTIKAGSIELPELEIWDKPAFPWRGMHLDVSRHFFPVEFIKKYIDILAFYKMNVFHWHLTDDQGWRIEIKSHPDLTRIGAFREDTRNREWSYDQFPVREGKPVYGGFYTQDEIREIVSYAGGRHVTIIPEIEMPGHSWAALYVYPHLSCSGKPFFKDPDVPFEFTDPFCAGNEETFSLLEDVLNEVMELFPSEHIHIGGDEAKKIPWEHCSKCQERIRSEGLNNVEELQSYFIERIGRYVKEKEHAIIGWDEILEGGIPGNAAIMSWRGEEGGMAAARQKHFAVMTPNSYTYLNRNQNVTNAENSDPLSLETVYSYDPVPADLLQEEHQYILGLQGCLWTEHIQTPEMAEYQLLPRLLAIAETGWTQKQQKNYHSFLERLNVQFILLDRMDYNYFIEPPRGLHRNKVFITETALELENPLGFGEIYILHGTGDPAEKGKVYQGPLTIDQEEQIQALIRLPSGKTSNTVSGNFIRMNPVAGSGNPQFKGLEVAYAEATISTLNSVDEYELVVKDRLETPGIPDFVSEDHFILEFRGYLKIEKPAVYTFATISDDGTRLFLHEKMLIDDDGVHGPVRVSGQLALDTGFHPFRLQYFEASYGEELKFEMLCDGIRVQPEFYHD